MRVFPNAVVGPATSVGFTDSTYARQAGARAYGWAPFMLTRGELESMHGANERLSLDQLALGVDAMLGVLLEVCLEPQGDLMTDLKQGGDVSDKASQMIK